MAINETRDERVDTNRLARSRRTGNQQVRHLCEIGDDRTALEILAECDWERSANVLELARLDQLAERDDLRGWIRNFDSNRSPSGNRRNDANALCAHRQGEIVGQIRDLTNFDTRRRYDLELCHNWTSRAANELSFDAKCSQRVHQLDPHRVELALSNVGVARRCRSQQFRRWKICVRESNVVWFKGLERGVDFFRFPRDVHCGRRLRAPLAPSFNRQRRFLAPLHAALPH